MMLLLLGLILMAILLPCVVRALLAVIVLGSFAFALVFLLVLLHA
jgi:hypothetical protein